MGKAPRYEVRVRASSIGEHSCDLRLTSTMFMPRPGFCVGQGCRLPFCCPGRLREIVKRLDMWGVDMLFVVGGNGGNAGANASVQAGWAPSPAIRHAATYDAGRYGPGLGPATAKLALLQACKQQSHSSHGCATWAAVQEQANGAMLHTWLAMPAVSKREGRRAKSLRSYSNAGQFGHSITAWRVFRCFGFDTAVEEAQRALLAAKVEASSARKGLGLVKLMGRQSGFIALQASMASGVVDACLIPEVPFKLGGPTGLLAYLESVIKYKGHCVVCVAEGAGQDLLEDGGSLGTDASGNPILRDIGSFLKSEFKKEEYFKDSDIKYIDPTYMIRAIPTTSTDRIYCKILAHNAVHAAFAGMCGGPGWQWVRVATAAGGQSWAAGSCSGQGGCTGCGEGATTCCEWWQLGVALHSHPAACLNLSKSSWQGHLDAFEMTLLKHSCRYSLGGVHAVCSCCPGFTGLTVGLVNTHYVYLPIPVVIQAPRKVDPRGKAWNRLRAAIGQPNFV
ncbi:PFK domain-containing protein [Haematococcus lacustris]|uniref:PFK domain-containing protein n=1 Tax=Haematococcus lacustris TaxID=44745 RepID=A0A699YVA1_HAELA|nr:PFK domain-containing protein [Haematococcus lacustris]